MMQLLICEADSGHITFLRKQLGELSLREELELRLREYERQSRDGLL